MASQNFLIPHTSRELETLATSSLVVTCAGAAFVAAAGLISRHLGSIPILNRLALQPATDQGRWGDEQVGDDGKPKPSGALLGRPGMDIGDWGVAISPLRPSGKARFGDQSLDVVSDGSYVDKGRQIRIVSIQGNRVTVCEVE
jgi:membrane-bound serine protease (ClpP class)